MNNNGNEIEDALNDIFGSDFINIDVDKDEDKESVVSEIVPDVLKEPGLIKKADSKLMEEKTKSKKKGTESKKIINKINENRKNIIYYLIGLVIITIVIYVLVNFVFGVTKTITCKLDAEDVGYHFTDLYKITYKKNKISYVESVYTYTALNDEYKGQIEYIKDDKVPVIVNSNGMPGFTYVYEASDDYIKVNGYLDFNLFEYDKIDKLDQNLMPISYFKINSKLTYKALKNNLEEKGYVCTLK